MQKSPHILVIRTGAIGDTILMSVVFQALRDHYPHAYIEAMGAVERLQLINTPGLIDKLTSSDVSGFAGLFVQDASLSSSVTAYFQRFDIILLYSFDPENIVTENLSKICAHRVYRFDPFPSEEVNIHITTYLLNSLQCLGIHATRLFPEIALPENGCPVSCLQKLRLAESHQKRATIAIHPGSGSPEKNWNSQHFAALCQRAIQTFHAKILLIGGPAESHSVQLIRKSIQSHSVIVLQNAPLLEIAEALKHCHVYVGNDSGMSHLAAAVGVRTIVLFGPSSPALWKPPGKNVVVLQQGRRPYCADISVDQVFTSLGFPERFLRFE